MIDDITAQCHMIVDALTFDQSKIALSALQATQEGQSEAGPFAQLLGLAFRQFAGGHSTASLEVKQHLLNPGGIAHGGAAFALADTACGAAAVSALGAERVVTQDMQIRYHYPARPGTLTAEAHVLHLGKRTITTTCQVKQNDLLVATATATFAILSVTGNERTGD